MSVRLFDEFQKKNMATRVSKTKSSTAGQQKETELCITIPLKSNSSNTDKPQELTEDYIRVIEYEYAVRYLETMGIEANQKAIANLLKNQPLSSCELNSGWNNSG